MLAYPNRLLLEGFGAKFLQLVPVRASSQRHLCRNNTTWLFSPDSEEVKIFTESDISPRNEFSCLSHDNNFTHFFLVPVTATFLGVFMKEFLSINLVINTPNLEKVVYFSRVQHCSCAPFELMVHSSAVWLVMMLEVSSMLCGASPDHSSHKICR